MQTGRKNEGNRKNIERKEKQQTTMETGIRVMEENKK